ncbi:hypothetical protein BGZ73_007003 [Actinomortierella ambigua]|nr:hypothetical protein BGZ73_007003 [Actinomortierella ambigua]
MRLSAALLFALTTGKDTSDGIHDGSCEMHPGIFRHPKNHAVAAASILTDKGRRADYIPSIPSKSKSESQFNVFVNSVANFPGFRVSDDIAYHLFLRHGGLEDLGRVVRDAVGSENGRILARTLREMIPESLNTPIEDVIFSVLVIEKPKGSDEVLVQLVELTLTLVQIEDGYGMVENQHRVRHSVIVPEQMTVMRIQVLDMLPKYLAVNARSLARSVACTTIDEFTAFFASRNLEDGSDTWFDFTSEQ